MVRITRVYTRTGDQGMTSLGSGERVAKDCLRVEAYGEIDELNSFLGLVLGEDLEAALRDELVRVQQELFDLGAELCIPESQRKAPVPEVRPHQIERLEKLIDAHTEQLAPLTSFILPGGTRSAALLHAARAVCRRAERRVITLARAEAVAPHVIVYLNRLSDALFVLARAENLRAGRTDVLWDPRRDRPGPG
ncbi:MAG: cob(I)yrinic acid a,c-diamide adenosyltransferase [Planctomycetota bacterium]